MEILLLGIIIGLILKPSDNRGYRGGVRSVKRADPPLPPPPPKQPTAK